MKVLFVQLVFILLIAVSCSQSEIDNRIALKIGDLEITNYEMQKQYNKRFAGDQPKSEKAQQQFKNDIIDQYLLIADAYRKKLDTLETIRKSIQYASDYFMIVMDGYMWKKQVVPVIDDYVKITPEKLQKRSKLYYFDIVRADNTTQLFALLDNDSIMDTNEEFNQLKQLQSQSAGITYLHTSMQWPFSMYRDFSDYLYAMHDGQISTILRDKDVVYYFRLDHIENIEVTDQNKLDLQMELYNIKSFDFNQELDQQMNLAGTPEINHPAVQKILDYIATNNSLTKYSGNDTVISYNLNGTRKHVTSGQFIEQQEYYPMAPVIGDERGLIEAINQYYYSDYLLAQAHSLGLFDDEVFKLDQKNFTNNLLHSHYMKTEIAGSIVIDSSEVTTFYHDNTAQFTRSKELIVDTYFFKNEEDANRAWLTLNDFYQNHPATEKIDPSCIVNLTRTLYDFHIDLENLTDYREEDLYKIQNLTVGAVSYGILYNKEYVIYIPTAQDGTSIKSLKEVYPQIEYQILTGRIETTRKNKIDSLKLVYQVTDNIDLNKLNKNFKL